MPNFPRLFNASAASRPACAYRLQPPGPTDLRSNPMEVKRRSPLDPWPKPVTCATNEPCESEHVRPHAGRRHNALGERGFGGPHQQTNIGRLVVRSHPNSSSFLFVCVMQSIASAFITSSHATCLLHKLDDVHAISTTAISLFAKDVNLASYARCR